MKQIIYIIAILFLLSSCENYITVNNPDFDVNVDSFVFHVDEPITFNINGNPDNIVFYSGEEGHQFEHRTRTKMDGNKLIVSFSGFVDNLVAGQVDVQIRLLVSTDFAGLYTTEGVESATWTDVSDRATFATNEVLTSSGDIDLTDFAVQELPVTLALQYELNNSNAANRWVIKSFEAGKELQNGVYNSIFSMTTAQWKSVDFQGEDNWQIPGNQLIMKALYRPNNDWVITRSIDMKEIYAVEPDRGYPIKNIATKINSYTHTYTKEGVYKVVFEAVNASVNESKSKVKEVEITVIAD